MFVHLILPVLLMLAALVYVVPAVTDSGVAIRKNSWVRGFLALIVLALANNIFWHLVIITGISLAVPLAFLKTAVIGCLVGAVGISLIGKIMPGVLYVRGFAAALGASVTMTLVGWAISHFLF